MEHFERMNAPIPPPQRPSPSWIIIALVVGFSLPVCTLMILLTGGLVGTGWLLTLAGSDTESGVGVGVLDLNGVIFQGEGNLQAGSVRLMESIQWLEDEKDVRAIVVLANSPGGDANASDIVWQRLSEVEKPVIVFVNGLCASGCYYIAMGADANEIYATPNSLIGSIGVISTFLTVDGLAEELGVDMQVVATGENKDFGNPFRRLTEEEITYWREQINITLDNFIGVVVAGRPNLSEDEIRALANGRVWSASYAEEIGLIDGLKYEQEAFDHAADLGGIKSDNYRRIRPPFEPTFTEILFGVESQIIPEQPSLANLSDFLQHPPLQYRYWGPATGVRDLD